MRPAWLAVFLVAAFPGAASAQETIGTPQRATPVSAYAGWVAWSEYDAVTGHYALMRRFGGEIAAVPVPPRAVPFDVDLGPDGHGNVVAAYSRCHVAPTGGNPSVRQWAAGTPQWSTGRGCDLYRFSFATGRETRLALSTATASEFLPTIWKGRVAYARARGKHAYLYLGHRRLPTPPRAERGVVEPGPSAMDLAGRRVAVAWETYREGPISEIDLVAVGHRRLIERFGSGEIQTVNLVSPVIRGGRVYYGVGQFGDNTQGDVNRLAIKTGSAESAPISIDRMLTASVPVSGGAYTLTFSDYPSNNYLLQRFSSLAWHPYDPHTFPLP